MTGKIQNGVVKIDNRLVGLFTAIVLGVFTFLWRSNSHQVATVEKMKATNDRLERIEEDIDEIKQDVKNNSEWILSQ